MIANSEIGRNNFVKLAGLDQQKVHLLPNAISNIEQCPFQHDKFDNDNFNVLFVGRLVEQKNPLFFVQIIDKLKSYQPNLNAFIAGEGTLMESLLSYINSLKLSHNIHLLGNVSFVSQYYNSFDCLITTSYYEGTPKYRN